MVRFPLVLLVVVSVGCVVSAGAVPDQGPGSSWKIVTTPEGATKTLYWDLFDRTEVWTRIVPKAPPPADRLPVNLIFSVIFKTKMLSSAQITVPPEEVVVVAESDVGAVLPIPTWSFVLTTDTGDTFDLVRTGRASRLLPCEGCYQDAITARLDVRTFKDLAGSGTVACNILGFACVLDGADTAALRRFGRYVKLLDE